MRKEVKRSKVSSIGHWDMTCRIDPVVDTATEVAQHETRLSGPVQNETKRKGGPSCMDKARSWDVRVPPLKKPFDRIPMIRRTPHPKSCVGLKGNNVKRK